MAGSLNRVSLIGNLGKDPEVRSTQDGMKICNLTVATSETWKDKMTGERKEKTEWHRISILNDRLADVAEKYLRKGSKVYIEGQLQTRKWTDDSGQERYTTEVLLGRYKGELVMLGGRNSDDGEYSASNSGHSSNQTAQSAQPDMAAELDDEIPF